MLERVNIQDVQKKLYQRLVPSGWSDPLKGFILSGDFTNILNTLLEQAKDNKRFTPVLKQVFRCFEECPYNSLKVVLLSPEPYPYPDVADGLAFSCSNNHKLQASLRYMLRDINQNIYQEEDKEIITDLKCWANQGVLLLNLSLTTTINKIDQHQNLWSPFIAYLFDILSHKKKDMIYVFLGKKSREWESSIPDNNYKLFCTHPASASQNNLQVWESGNIFGKINEILISNNKQQITW
jgi:uracil-DNA glycosylase